MVTSNLMEPLSEKYFDDKIEEVTNLLEKMRGELLDTLGDAREETENVANNVKDLRSDFVALIQRIDGNKDYSGEIADLDTRLQKLGKELGK